MRTEQQIEAAAAAAAEKANGGKFTDPLFYKPEHRAFWKEVIRTALDAADAHQHPRRNRRRLPRAMSRNSPSTAFISGPFTLLRCASSEIVARPNALPWKLQPAHSSKI